MSGVEPARTREEPAGGWDAPGDARYDLTLFVNGASERSAQAIADVHELCAGELADRCRLRIVDVNDDVELVIQHRVLASPTLIKDSPLPVRMLVGDLSDPARVLAALDVRGVPEPGPSE